MALECSRYFLTSLMLSLRQDSGKLKKEFTRFAFENMEEQVMEAEAAEMEAED
ncbi:Nbs-lrr resistance protein [Corchorus capsularis]|uniref:Nbs-lrr resistance protein n=1 Tax=Corchorus capsularis TaxID=210143 RepID=A0A1R3H8G6_COCAP|nr:Nbs-lrr resistance protein [Corchorus capsularis]